MTQYDIIRMAREAGLAYGSDEKPLASVLQFAALVAAAAKAEEREECAMLAERSESAAHCAAAIRARGQQ